jgi:hypothetical protein
MYRKTAIRANFPSKIAPFGDAGKVFASQGNISIDAVSKVSVRRGGGLLVFGSGLSGRWSRVK